MHKLIFYTASSIIFYSIITFSMDKQIILYNFMSLPDELHKTIENNYCDLQSLSCLKRTAKCWNKRIKLNKILKNVLSFSYLNLKHNPNIVEQSLFYYADPKNTTLETDDLIGKLWLHHTEEMKKLVCKTRDIKSEELVLKDVKKVYSGCLLTKKEESLLTMKKQEKMFPQLLKFITDKNVSMVKTALAKNEQFVEIIGSNHSWMGAGTLLEQLCQLGDCDVIYNFLSIKERGIDSRRMGQYSALEYSCKNKNIVLVEFLLDKGATITDEAFMIVCKNEWYEGINLLLSAGFNSKNLNLNSIFKRSSLGVIQHLIAKCNIIFDDQSYIFLFCACNNTKHGIDIVNFFVTEKGFSPDIICDQKTLLEQACLSKNVKVITFLAERVKPEVCKFALNNILEKACRYTYDEWPKIIDSIKNLSPYIKDIPMEKLTFMMGGGYDCYFYNNKLLQFLLENQRKLCDDTGLFEHINNDERYENLIKKYKPFYANAYYMLKKSILNPGMILLFILALPVAVYRICT
ncbi:MAG TPA: hypothetical protein VLB80_04700 [Candidatus Babeliales bacterium]|nr:hypothetical protein [Candidatus Babeliales bacterium]